MDAPGAASSFVAAVAADAEGGSTALPQADDALVPSTGPRGPISVRGRSGSDDGTTVVLVVDAPRSPTRLLEVRCRTDREADVHHHVVGELCVYTSPVLIEFLESARADRDVVLDLSRLTFIDSHGVTACLDLVERWHARGRRLEVANPSALVCRLATIMGVDAELFDAAPPRRRRAPSHRRPSTLGAVSKVPSDPPERRSSSGAPATVTVRNLERGQVIEVAVDGTLDADESHALARRLDTLSAKREPAELRVDLTRARPPHDPRIVASLHRAADVLDAIGSRLVVVGADPRLGEATPAPEPRSAAAPADAPRGWR